MRFLVQKIDRKLKFDFQRELVVAQDYAKWRGMPFSIKYCTDIPELKHPEKYVPVGSVEFVLAFVEKYYPDKIANFKPKNVPECLFEYAGRNIANILPDTPRPDWLGDQHIYAKSNDVIKDPDNGMTDGQDLSKLVGKQVSSLVAVKSEWRVFVYHNLVQQVCYYDGDPLVFPDRRTIEDIVCEYSQFARTPAYTFDVFVDGSGDTHIMELHDFFSCGLYGFADYRYLPYMLSQTFYSLTSLTCSTRNQI